MNNPQRPWLRRNTRPAARLSILADERFEPLEQRQLLATVFAVTTNNTLLQFDSAAPSAIIRSTPITGLGTGQSIGTIDFRPGVGTLYGMASGTRTPLYTLNPNTGAATQISNGLPGGFDVGFAVGMDFDDLTSNGSSAGILRYTDEFGGSYRFDPNTGIYIRNDAGREGLTDVAYRRTNGDAGSFQMVGINYQTDEVQILNPMGGQVISSGPLGVDTDKWATADILGDGLDGVIYVTLRVNGSTRFGRIDADGHTFVDLGTVGDGTATIRGMSFDPDPVAPVIANNAVTALATINEDETTNTGTLVSSLIAPGGTRIFSDSSPGALDGIAITGADSTHGVWQYTLNGTTWQDVGSVSDSGALLLSSDGAMRIRFVPATNFNGTISGGLTLRAWDRTTDTAGTRVSVVENGGSTAYSLDSVAASITVSPVRDAPTLSIPQPSGGAYTLNDNQTVMPFATANIGYLDNAGQALTIDVSGDLTKGDLTDASVAAAGFTRLGDGSVRFVGTAVQAQAALRQLVYRPLENIAPVGTSTVSVFTVLVNDQLGAPVQALSPFISSRSVRDVPVVGLTPPPNGFFTITDVGSVLPFGGVSISTVDQPAPTLTVDVLYAASLGSFTSESMAAAGFVQFDASTLRFTGTAAAATAAARQLVFQATANVQAAGVVTPTIFRLSVSDGQGPAVEINSPEVRIESVNDAPTVTGFTINNRIKLAKTVKVFRNVTVQDADPNQPITALIVLNKPAKGKFTPASLLASGFARAGRGRWTFTGTAAALTTSIRRLQFQYNATVASGQLHPVKLSLTVTDASGASVVNGNTGVQVRL